MRRETAVHFRKTQDGDVLVDESGARLEMAAAESGGGGMSWEGAWSDMVAYQENDVVKNRGNLYICTEPVANGEPGAPGLGDLLPSGWTSAQTDPDPTARFITVGSTDLAVVDGGPTLTWATGDSRPVAIGVLDTNQDVMDLVGKVTATIPAGLQVTRYGQWKPYATQGLSSIGAMTSGTEYDLDNTVQDFSRIVFVATGVNSTGRGTVELNISKLSGSNPINVPDASTSWDLMVQGT